MFCGHALRVFFVPIGMFVALTMLGCSLQTKPEGMATLAVAQTEKGVMIWLPENVLFGFDKATLDSEDAELHLARVAQLLNDKSDKPILLEGHTDNVGRASYNLDLSDRRARTVMNRLSELGVSASRMSAVGVGMDRPIAPNDIEVGRKLNRRVEITLLNETLANLTRNEPADAFEEAFVRLKRLLEQENK